MSEVARRDDRAGGTGSDEDVDDGITDCQMRTLRYHAAKERLFYRLGRTMASPTARRVVPAVVFVAALLFAIGLVMASIETDVNKLWVESGGRLESEDQYVDDARAADAARNADATAAANAASLGSSSGSSGRSNQFLISVANPESGDYLTPQRLQAHLDMMEYLQTVTVEAGGAEFNLNDLCYKPDAPDGFQAAISEIPCIRVTVLDCFTEGGFDFSDNLLGLLTLPTFEELLAPYDIDGYLERPSFNNASVNIHDVVRHGCPGFARSVSALFWEPGLIMGGIEREGDADGDGPIQRVAAIQSVVLLDSSSSLAARLLADEDVIKEALDLWKKRFVDVVHDSATVPSSDVTNYALASNSLELLLERVSSASAPLVIAGYVIMVLFVVAALTSWDNVESQALFGLTALLMVVLSTLGAFGFATLVGIKFNATSTQVLPFLALGMGVDDLFVIAFAFREVRERYSARKRYNAASIPEQVGRCFAVAGSSITLTSFANFFAFLAGSLVPLPAVTAFCQQAAIDVAFNYIALLLGTPGLLAIHAHYSNNGMKAVKPLWLRRVEEWVSRKVGGTRAPNPTPLPSLETGDGASASMEHDDSGQDTQQLHHPPTHSADAPRRGACWCTRWRNPRVSCGRQYADFILKPRSQVAIVATTVILLILCAVGATLVEDGLDLDDVAPSDSHEARFLDQRFNYFSWFPSDIMVPDVDYPNSQTALLQLEQDLAQLPKVTLVPRSWLRELIDWTNGTEVGLDANGVIPPARFYEMLSRWLVSSDSQLDAVIAGANTFSYNDAGELTLTWFQFYVDDLWNVDDFVTLIDGVRGLSAESGLRVFPRGIPFSFWEQYVHLREFLLQNVAIALAAVCVVTCMLLFDIASAVVVVVTIAAITFEIFGFLGLAGIKFSALPAVSIIMSVGVSVEFTAHLVQAFKSSLHDARVDRVRDALSSMALPIVNGGVSTLVGIMMLAFSPFGFIVKYFFGVFAVVVLLGLWNGLVLLPVVLSWCGPPPVVPKVLRDEQRARQAAAAAAATVPVRKASSPAPKAGPVPQPTASSAPSAHPITSYTVQQQQQPPAPVQQPQAVQIASHGDNTVPPADAVQPVHVTAVEHPCEPGNVTPPRPTMVVAEPETQGESGRDATAAAPTLVGSDMRVASTPVDSDPRVAPPLAQHGQSVGSPLFGSSQDVAGAPIDAAATSVDGVGVTTRAGSDTSIEDSAAGVANSANDGPFIGADAAPAAPTADAMRQQQ